TCCWGWIWFGLGLVGLFWLGNTTGALGLALTLCILLYDATHKRFFLAPFLMGLCRFFVYVIAASTASKGVTAWSLWCGLAMAVYITGLSYLARRESVPNQPTSGFLPLPLRGGE